MKKIFALAMTLFCIFSFCSVHAEETQYKLDQVVILSRHHIRSPLSGSGSMLERITPHSWFEWTSRPSELSLRGAVLETMMGQYFRLWMESEKLIPENYRPGENEVRIHANSLQRTIATSRCFSAGLLPVANIPVEYHAEYDTMDPTFSTAVTFVTDAYVRDATAQIAQQGGTDDLRGIHARVKDAIALLMEVTDMRESEDYQSGVFGDLLSDVTEMIFKEGKEPFMIGFVGTASSIADALTLQYYEEPDEKKAAFGHEISEKEWRQIHSIVDAYIDALYGAHLVAVNVAHPLLQELRSELKAEGRKITYLCGHDANLASVLSAMNVEPYLLPETLEQHTPIGSKLVFEKWLDERGEAWYRVCMVYQSTQQLRNMTQLSIGNPPVVYPLDFKGVAAAEGGMIPEKELLDRLDDAIAGYDEMVEQYTEDEVNQEAA